MNITTTIKPSGIAERTTQSDVGLIITDVLWSDSGYTWSDATVMWSVGKFSNNALPPSVSIESIKSKLGIKIIKP